MSKKFKIENFYEFRKLLFIIYGFKNPVNYFGSILYVESKLICSMYINSCEEELEIMTRYLTVYCENTANAKIHDAIINFLEIVLKARQLLNNIEKFNFEKVKDEIHTHLCDISECSEIVVYSIIFDEVDCNLKDTLNNLNAWILENE